MALLVHENEKLELIGTKRWWIRLIEEWNISSYKTRLANFNQATFIIHNSECPKIVIFWDAVGEAKILDFFAKDMPTFSGPINNWQDFIDGKFGSAEGVMKGKLKFEGSLFAVFPFLEGFNALAKVGKTITDPKE